MSRDVHSCTHWPRPRNPPYPPVLGLVYEGAIGQQRKTTSLCNSLGKIIIAVKNEIGNGTKVSKIVSS
jgi:hypothetical protein